MTSFPVATMAMLLGIMKSMSRRRRRSNSFWGINAGAPVNRVTHSSHSVESGLDGFRRVGVGQLFMERNGHYANILYQLSIGRFVVFVLDALVHVVVHLGNGREILQDLVDLRG